MTEALVGFDGGPMDDVTLTGLFAHIIVEHAPPFVCMDVDGRHEHYLSTDDCECGVRPCYAYAGPCRDLTPHPPCGHDHTP